MNWHKELREHSFDYTLLLCGVILTCIAYLQAWPERVHQAEIGLFLGLFYTFWGIWHHSRCKNLTGKIFLEYAAYGLLVSIFLWLIAW